MRWNPAQFAEKISAPVLILGGAGMLGRAWRELLTAAEVKHHSADVAEIDITRDESVRSITNGPWRTVINCAAWTDVDGAEEHEAAATEVNGRAVARLAEACRTRRGSPALLVHYSTDYVFRGDSERPYAVDQPRQPLNAYGRSKAAGEEALETSGAEFLLIRTSWLYAPWARNFVRTIAAAARQRPVLKVVNDQHGRPTSAEHLARLTAALMAVGARGTYHGADGGECTWYELAAEVVRLTGADCRVEPCTTADFPRPAKRPAYSVLDLAKTESLIGPMPDWRDNLADVIARLEL
jgi:dTDP-4-dehydrorhamnose reductase